MRGRARVGTTAALAALTLGITACTGGSGGDVGSTDGKAGRGSQPGPAKPGTHASLPEPCGAPSEDTLHELLVNGDEQRPADERKELLPEGTAAITFDIERRVGCQWKSTSSLGSHHLTIDFERVVSYDSAVSDDDRAAELYDAKALKADIPAQAPDAQQSGDPDDSQTGDEADETEDDDSEGASPNSQDPDSSAGGDDESASPADAVPTPDPALAPRPVEGIGDAAYLNDELVTADSGLHRDITLVFRAGNVIVTVEYDQWSTDKRLIPGSETLQERAQKLAKQLAEQLNS